jgi:murein L,D-transpeptidase YcbB/YkuD
MRFMRSLLLIALLGATVTGTFRYSLPARAEDPSPSPAPTTPTQDLAPEIASLLAAGAIPGSPTPDERDLLESLYAPETPGPLWLDEFGALNPAGRQAVELLAGADSHGLNVAHYRVDTDPATLAPFEIELSLAMLRYLGDVTFGRVTPASVGHQLPARSDRSSLPTLLRHAASAGHTLDAVTAAMPVLGGYEGLRNALVTYRALAAGPALPALPMDSASIHVGEPLPWASALRAHLVAYGDLASSVDAAEGDVYGPALELGVKHFQRRHALTDDGVIGKGTLAALRTPVATRVRQIELALERLRWLPRDLTGRVLVVNIPMYRLDAFEDAQSAQPAISMRVVVGTVGRNATPVLASQIKRVVFRPYWNVPRSIVTGELLPKARADRGYLDAHRYELVRGNSDKGEVVPVSDESLQALASGALRLRQLPGPGNALGMVKFDFANAHDVFLHDTPSQLAFQRDRRALSHGCVRVGDPLSLAAWVLDGPAWSREAVTDATNARDAQVVQVARPVHVLLLYTTAAAEADGTVHFAADIYGHDAKLALRLR